jgi:hypothetical protein
MPEQETLKRARADAQQGKSPSTQAGEFGREELHHIRSQFENPSLISEVLWPSE